MGKVECGSIDGLLAWFNSNDHLPPHFHVERAGEWEVRVMLLFGSVAAIESRWGPAPSRSDRRKILRFLEKHRTELLEEFERKVRPAGS